MRICIFGAGAVGSHFAVRLALAGHTVSCVMRGPHLEAVKAKGLTLRVGDTDFSARVKASDDPAALGPQDFVISTLKATGLSSLAAGLAPLLRDDTAVVFAQNGIPWWYELGLPPDQPPPPDLSFLDPGGPLRTAVSQARIVGGVIFSSNEITAPGIVVNDSPERNMLLVGECDDRQSERIQRLRMVLAGALIQSRPVPRIREAIWKPRAPPSRTPRCRMWCRACSMRRSPSRSCYPAATRRSGAAPNHRPSLLQDYERGRPMEIDALVRAPQTFARAAGLSTPTLDALAALAMCPARDKGLYQQV